MRLSVGYMNLAREWQEEREDGSIAEVDADGNAVNDDEEPPTTQRKKATMHEAESKKRQAVAVPLCLRVYRRKLAKGVPVGSVYAGKHFLPDSWIEAITRRCHEINSPESLRKLVSSGKHDKLINSLLAQDNGLQRLVIFLLDVMERTTMPPFPERPGRGARPHIMTDEKPFYTAEEITSEVFDDLRTLMAEVNAKLIEFDVDSFNRREASRQVKATAASVRGSVRGSQGTNNSRGRSQSVAPSILAQSVAFTEISEGSDATAVTRGTMGPPSLPPLSQQMDRTRAFVEANSIVGPRRSSRVPGRPLLPPPIQPVPDPLPTNDLGDNPEGEQVSDKGDAEATTPLDAPVGPAPRKRGRPRGSLNKKPAQGRKRKSNLANETTE